MAKPTILPEFATDDLVDPTEGTNNVLEPDLNAKQYGWVPAFTTVFRNWLNWIHRHTYLWLKYIDGELEPLVNTNVTNIATNVTNIATNVTNIGFNTSGVAANVTNISSNAGRITTNETDILARTKFSSGVLNCEFRTGDFASQEAFNITYFKIGKIVTLFIPSMIRAGSGTTSQVRIYPVTTWPTETLALTVTGYLQIPLMVYTNPAYYIGAILLPKTISEEFTLVCPGTSGNGLSSTNFASNSDNKGFQNSSISYISETEV